MKRIPEHMEPRFDPGGRYERECQYRGCRVKFRTNNPRTRYHEKGCRKAEQNARYYGNHAKAIIKKAMSRKKEKE
jgi:hypothetical protein